MQVVFSSHMSLMDEDTGHETPGSSGRSARLLVLLLAGAAVAALATWALWPSAPTKTDATRAPVAASPPATQPSPAVEPQPAAQPGETAGLAEARARRAKAKAAPVVEPAARSPAPTTGTLKIESDVPGASVFLDREFKGAAPVTIDGVTPGSHRLNVAADGFQSYADTIEVPSGPSTVEVRFKEVKLNESIQVVHKHTAGSCEGRLVADTQGIRYETSNKDDAFVMKHAEIETFDVDYLKKNLRIKRRGGRTYNFTNDSADALFVFHKNVQAARARLAKGDAPSGKGK
jgi:hypothetical protein